LVQTTALADNGIDFGFAGGFCFFERRGGIDSGSSGVSVRVH